MRTQIHGPDRRRGAGPPLVLLAGVAGDHSDLDLLVPWLEPYVSPQLLQRSRPGLDDASYAIERAFLRLAAALDAIDGPVDAFAQGFDATLLLGAMPLTRNLRRAILYEPGAGLGPRELTNALDDPAARVDDRRSPARRHPVHLSIQPDGAGHGGPDVDRADLDRDLGRRQRLAREHRAADRWTFGPATYRAHTPTLLLVGSASPPRAHQATEIARQALPNSRVNLLDGQAHAAASDAPELLSQHIAWFVNDEPPPSRQETEMPSTRHLR